jgi:hypothetical protein
MFNGLKVISKAVKMRLVLHPPLKKFVTWGYFDEAGEGISPLGGACGILYMNKYFYIYFKVGLG